MKHCISRREFFRNTSLAAAAFWIGGRNWAKGQSPNEFLNIGLVGTANRAKANIEGLKDIANIAAICDVDDNYLALAAKQFPKAKKYNDWRRMLEQKDLDAVVVSTADHCHAIVSIAAMKTGRHVYCEKPAAHNVYEARMMAQVAAETKVATQLGTQIHAENNYRRVVELIQTGAIGPVREAHCWNFKSKTGEVPSGTPPVPPHLHWDLWLGPAPEKPYHPNYHPANWRNYWHFGGGTLADIGCHFMDLPFWALKLRAPLAIEAEGPPVHPEVAPAWLQVKYEFAPRGDMPAVKMFWYDGGRKPAVLDEQKVPVLTNNSQYTEKKEGEENREGILFVGDKGLLMSNYFNYLLWPSANFKDFKAPEPFIPNSIGHYKEWIQACKTGSPTTCHFDYSCALSETVLLGSVAYRTGKRIEWDPVAMKARNAPEADNYIRRQYRKGWSLM